MEIGVRFNAMPVTFDSIKQAKTILVNTLRTAFGERSGEQKYKYVANEYGGPKVKLPDSDPSDAPFTEIFISDIYPYKEKFLPAIVISQGSANDFQEAFNQEMAEKFNDSGEIIARRYAGGWHGSYSVLVATESTKEREEIADLVGMYLMRIKRNDAEQEGVFIKNVSNGSEADEPYRNDFVYLLPIAVDVYTEWLHEVPVNTIEAVNITSIDIPELGEGLPVSP